MNRIFPPILAAALLLFLEFVCYGKVDTFKYAPELERSVAFSVTADGVRQTVLQTKEPDFCIFDCDAPVTVKVSYCKAASRVDVRPVSLDFSHKFEDGVLTLTMKPTDRVVVEFDGDTSKPLFIFANPIDKNKPSDKTPYTTFLKAGQIYYFKDKVIPDGTTLYIEGGAYVIGNIKTSHGNGVVVTGSGIIDGRTTPGGIVRFRDCRDVMMRGVTILNCTNWTTHIGESDGIDIDNVKVIAEFNFNQVRGLENDAFNLNSCSNARVTHCFAYCHDDAYCVKAGAQSHAGPSRHISYEDIIMWNVRGGNSIVIGSEIYYDCEDVSYKDVYSIHKRNNPICIHSSDIGIHSKGSGTISNVRYENIYLEETDNYTIYFQTANIDGVSGFVPGLIKDVTLKNIHVLYDQPFGSKIIGYDSSHPITNVRIENLYLKAEKASSLEQALITVKNASVEISK